MKRITAFFIMALTAACTILTPTVSAKTVAPPHDAFILESPSAIIPAVGLSLEPETPTPTKTFIPARILVSSQVPTLTLTLATGLPPQPTHTPNPTQAKQQEDVKQIIQAYFAIRYDALSTSPTVDIQENMFGDLIADSDDARNFLVTEVAKLAVERKWHELNKNIYAAYQYSLKYHDIVIHPTTQTAEISLGEYFEIICQRSMENHPDNPKACAIGELTHQITMQIEQGAWKIVADVYRDSWWRQFREPGLSTDAILDNIHLEMQRLEAMPTPTP